MPPRHLPPAWETAVPEEETGNGCFSAFLIPPLLALFLSLGFGYWAWNFSPSPARANFPPAGLSPIFRAEVQYWAGSITRWAEAAGVDANFAATVMQIESCGDPLAKSPAGAAGLFQVMPQHFLAGENPFTPETNALRGLAYLAKSLEISQGNPRLALAGYNGGIGVISRAEALWAAETQRYVRYAAPIYADARGGLPVSAALQEWYLRYGVTLCAQASRSLRLE